MGRWVMEEKVCGRGAASCLTPHPDLEVQEIRASCSMVAALPMHQKQASGQAPVAALESGPLAVGFAPAQHGSAIGYEEQVGPHLALCGRRDATAVATGNLLGALRIAKAQVPAARAQTFEDIGCSELRHLSARGLLGAARQPARPTYHSRPTHHPPPPPPTLPSTSHHPHHSIHNYPHPHLMHTLISISPRPPTTFVAPTSTGPSGIPSQQLSSVLRSQVGACEQSGVLTSRRNAHFRVR